MTPTPTGTIPALKATQSAATATKLAAIENTATAAPLGLSSVKGPYSGLQAFYFQSNDTAPCDQAPHDGILIQSPQGTKQRVTLVIDGATISLGSTVYITAQPGKFLTVNTLEGSATVTAAGRTQTATDGLAIQVPIDANLHASAAPTTPQLYKQDAVRLLPTRVLPTTTVIFSAGLPSDLTFANWAIVKYVDGTGCFVGGTDTGWGFNPDNAKTLFKIGYTPTVMYLSYISGRFDILSKSTQGTYDSAYFVDPRNVKGKDSATVLDPTHITLAFTTIYSDGSTCVSTLELAPSN